MQHVFCTVCAIKFNVSHNLPRPRDAKVCDMIFIAEISSPHFPFLFALRSEFQYKVKKQFQKILILLAQTLDPKNATLSGGWSYNKILNVAFLSKMITVGDDYKVLAFLATVTYKYSDAFKTPNVAYRVRQKRHH